MKKLPTNPVVKFRLSTGKTGEPRVKVFRDDRFVANIYGDKEGVRLVSKYFDGVEYKTGRHLAVVIKLSGG